MAWLQLPKVDTVSFADMGRVVGDQTVTFLMMTVDPVLNDGQQSGDPKFVSLMAEVVEMMLMILMRSHRLDPRWSQPTN